MNNNNPLSARIGNHLFVSSPEKAINNLVRRECLKPVSGIAWCATVEIDDDYLFSATISEEKPLSIYTGEGCAEIRWFSVRSDFDICEAGTIRGENLALDGLTRVFVS